MKKILKKVLFFIFRVLYRPFVLFLEYTESQRILQKGNLLKQSIQSCGMGVQINGDVFIFGGKSVVIGNNVHIGKNCYFFGEGGLTIGHNTHFSRNVTIYTANHDYESTVLPYNNNYKHKPVSIGKNVWIGMNVSIIPGVTIGDGSIIGMGCIVVKDVPKGSIVGVNSQKIIKFRNLELYQKLVNEKKYGGISGVPLSKENTLVFDKNTYNRNKEIFFVLTTGRSGSTTFAKTLNQHPLVSCLHEPRFQLIRLSSEYEHGIKNAEEVRREIHNIYCDSSTYPDLIYGECDQKNFNLIPFLNEIFPNAKFIWLIRNARDVVSSTFSRKWFSKEDNLGVYTQYRLNPDLLLTEKLTPFEKNCWYWTYVNQRIFNDLQEIPSARKTILKLENLETGLQDVCRFLNLPQFDFKIKKHNKSLNKVVSSNDWTVIQNKQFNNICKELNNQLYK